MSWSYTYSPDMWPAIITVASAAVLGLYSWRRRKMPAAIAFAIGCLFVVFWALGSALEISALDLSTKIFWLKFQAVWQLPTGTAFPCFVLAYAGLSRWLTRRNLLFLALPPLLALGFIITNDYHHLFWTGFRMDQYVIPSQGIVNRVFLGYGYLLGVLNLIILIWLAARSPRHRWPIAIMLSGQVIGRGVYLLDYLYSGLFPPGEFVLFSLGVLSGSYGLAFFRFHIIDPVPAARTAALEQMQDGVIVLDLKQHIVEVNPAAAKILGKAESNLRGRPIAGILTAGSAILAQLDKTPPVESEISLVSNSASGYYYLNFTSLTDRQGDAIGHLLLLHDVTEQKRAQAKITAQQRAMATLQERERLAHELHDSTSQVLGYVNLQAQTIQKWLQSGDNQKAEVLVSRLAEIAKDAHADVRESILNLRLDLTKDWSFISALKQYINNFQENYRIRIDLIITDEVGDNTLFPEAGIQLLRVIQETLTNARKHSNASNVTIKIEQAGPGTHIVIMDDGAGFDIKQYDVSNDGHFGLVFMRERMEHIGGSIKIDSKPGEGTTVTLYVPIREQMEETK